MIPDSVEQFTTDGERQVYRFFETVAKPDSDYIVWYTPNVKGRGRYSIIDPKNLLAPAITLLETISIITYLDERYWR